ELLSQLEGARYLERTSVHTAQNVIKAKKAVRKAFQNQIDDKGFSLVEILSMCPTNWGMTPPEGVKFVAEKMVPFYPLGVYKSPEQQEGGAA
ncbi:MAG: 2-oxoglutarate oxidoreductase, partial [Candidatus Edwardsbacteria bacterium]|nr:2-oxoglutarate oxidoreductase [Candidatus Edwardsbacteria bacterium]